MAFGQQIVLALWLVVAIAQAGHHHHDDLEADPIGHYAQGKQSINGVDIHLAEPTGTPDGDALQAGTTYPDRNRTWIVFLRPNATNGTMTDVRQRLESSGARNRFHGNVSRGLPVVVTDATEQHFRSALKSSDVLFVEQDMPVSVKQQSSPPSWGLDRIDARAGLDQSYLASGNTGGSGVHVYVLDSGILTTHADFEGRAIPSYDVFGSGECSPSNSTCALDVHGHGTHCAGIIGGHSYGVAKSVTLHAVKVLDDSGSGSSSGIFAAMNYVSSQGLRPAVISMSFGGPGTSRGWLTAVNSVVAAGVTVVVAAGNENSDACSYSPAFVPSAITVGATDRTDSRASYSNLGTCVDLFAPGSSITSAGITSNTASAVMSGTSMACPHVAGAAALALSQNPSASPADVLNKLLGDATANSLGQIGTGSPNLLLYTPPSHTGPATTATTLTSTRTTTSAGTTSTRTVTTSTSPATTSTRTTNTRTTTTRTTPSTLTITTTTKTTTSTTKTTTTKTTTLKAAGVGSGRGRARRLNAKTAPTSNPGAATEALLV